ncbi:Ornithine carbamoyltransferase [Prochlorococcus sp. SS52]|nr:Ornithine carbamoyltransferase [Prochlorococcus marinus str. LG]KGG22166.1 Ornithine carbamoyltransferase [Prochlorococcus marinus str. SS2]KGG24516.1 Ornithine carbamoyltransferase [Prochlorococcus marinus str. SS35]KGG33411.1 Ornithine carbamoyltransferase [Prochlorococcus marinus str. SS51]KGG37327.1 Ornithine carbamoyltransferase [Prochlorococcus sp. SS52]
MNSLSVSRVLADLAGKDFISCSDFTSDQVKALLQLSSQLKNGDRRIDLGNRVLGLIFSKASTRTRVSFQVAMARLGGQTIDLSNQATQLARGEPLKDTARVLSRYCDALALRTFGNDELIEYAKWSSIPVINALTDLEHPCQALADFLTIKEAFGSLDGITLAYIGDGNNVLNSLMICGTLLGVNIQIASPKGFEPLPSIVERAKTLAHPTLKICVSNNPIDAVSGAHVIYTDVWASMGQESEQAQRKEIFEGYTVNKDLVDKAEKESIILHCLPAHRGEEITDDVLESSASRIFDQAENRLHVQQALLAALLGGL